jgi:hypothetical protein
MGDPFIAECNRRARELIEGRDIILAGMPLAGATRGIDVVRALGAARVFVVATGTGTGPLPDAKDAQWVVAEIEADDIISEMRASERLLEVPPPEVIDAVTAFDPNGDALLFIAYVEAATHLGPRAAYGPRRPEWVALEDKTTCDSLFDAANVPRPPSRVVSAEHAALRAAAGELDRGAGTVWAGDARDGFNGGGTYVRWIRAGDDGIDAAAFFAANCDRVRVAPFVDGVSCSVHGFVTDDGVAALRPVELVNLRRPAGDRLLYAGCANFWDPALADREAMRAAARRLGEALRARVDYRGAFTLDGIMGGDGFVATECNPRPGAGLGYVRGACPELPFDTLQYLAVAGDAPWLRAADLEAAILGPADDLRWGGGWTPIFRKVEATTNEPLVHDGRGFRAARDGEEADATLSIGPGASGGFLRVTFAPERTPVGPSIGPRIVAAFAYADEHRDAGIGPAAAVVPVR